MLGLGGKALSPKGEKLPGDNFDIYGNAALGVVAGQAVLTGIDIAGGVAVLMYVSRLLGAPRPFLSFPSETRHSGHVFSEKVVAVSISSTH